VMGTPFGLPVVPLVKRSSAGVSVEPRIAGNRASPRRSAEMRSTGTLPATLVATSCRESATSSALARDACTSRESSASGWRSVSATAVAPAAAQPANAATHCDDGGARSPTRPPVSPCAASPDAMADALFVRSP
jgi:hypothetical protein